MRPAATPRVNILRQEDLDAMGRRAYTHPEVLRTHHKRDPDYWYIRPRDPLRGQPRVFLGWCPTTRDPVARKARGEITPREAEKIRDEKCREINRSPLVFQERMKVGAFVEQYREGYFPSLGIATQRLYDSVIRTHILPTFAGQRLCDVSGADVRAWIGNRPGTKNSRRTILAVLSSIFEAAGDWGYLSKRNPSKNVKVGQARRPRRRLLAFGPVDIYRIVQAASEPMRSQIEVAAFCGLRVGEIQALTPAALLGHQINVFQHMDKTGEILDSAKDDEDRRVPCPAFLMEKLRGWATGKRAEDLLWDEVGYEGMKNRIRDILERLGLYRKGAGWHALRASYRTIRRSLGDTGVQEAMGHNSEAMSERYYRPGLMTELAEVERMVALVYREARNFETQSSQHRRQTV